VALAVGAAALAIYLWTLLPGIAFGDWGELQTVPWVLGIAHPTGYPSYVLLAAAADRIPIGTVAWRGNVLSAVLVAASLSVTVLILRRLDVRASIAAAGALAVGAATTVWSAALVAEANPLHLLLAALIVHRALVWAERRSVRDLALGGLLVGLSFGNHLLTITIAPFIALFVVWSGRAEIRERPWILLVPLVTLVVGLLVYLYLPIRASQDPPLAYNHPDTLEGVIALVSGTQFQYKFDFLSGTGPGELVAALGPIWNRLTAAATPVLPVLGAFGLLVIAVRQVSLALALAGIFAGALYIYATYEALEHYLLVPLLVLGIGAAVALEWLACGLVKFGARWFGPCHERIGTVVVVAGLVMVVALAVVNRPLVDRSGDRRGEAYVGAVFDLLSPDAVLLSYWHITTPIWHAQLVEGMRPDVLVIDDSNIVNDGWGTREEAIAAFVCERPVFIVRPDDRELDPARARFELEWKGTLPVATGGTSAVVARPIYEVLGPSGGCPTS
jgi:hypothetical protein